MVVVAVEGFDVEDAGVAAGAVEVAGAEGAEEFGEVGEGVLCYVSIHGLQVLSLSGRGLENVRIISAKLAVWQRLYFSCRG